MSEQYYDPTGDAWDKACDDYDASDQFPTDAWDWITSQPVPPAWLAHLVEYHYRGTPNYYTKVDDRLEERAHQLAERNTL